MLYTCHQRFLLPLGSGTAKWPSKDIAYAWQTYLPESVIPKADQRAMVRDIWQSIADVCGLQAVYTDDINDAHVVYTTASGRRAGLDGPGGTLAYAYLPAGVPVSYRNKGIPGAGLCVMDLTEPWTRQRKPQRGISYYGVVKHESGHTGGLEHVNQQRDGENIMEPVYDSDVDEWGRLDIEEWRRRYGLKRDTSPAPPVPATPSVPSVPGNGAYATEVLIKHSDGTILHFDKPTNRQQLNSAYIDTP